MANFSQEQRSQVSGPKWSPSRGKTWPQPAGYFYFNSISWPAFVVSPANKTKLCVEQLKMLFTFFDSQIKIPVSIIFVSSVTRYNFRLKGRDSMNRSARSKFHITSDVTKMCTPVRLLCPQIVMGD